MSKKISISINSIFKKYDFCYLLEQMISTAVIVINNQQHGPVLDNCPRKELFQNFLPKIPHWRFTSYNVLASSKQQ